MRDVAISLRDTFHWTQPNGVTRLFDTAIEEITLLSSRIKEYKENHPGKKVQGVFQLFSDGFDNQSEKTRTDLQQAIETARTEGISCIYLGIGQNAEEIGQSYGFSVDNSLSADLGDVTSSVAFRSCSLHHQVVRG